MINIFNTYKELFTERCNHIPLLELGEDSIRYDFFIALTKIGKLQNYEIILESPLDERTFVPRQISPRTTRKQKPKMDLVVDKLNLSVEFGLFRQNSNEEGTINKTTRLYKTLNDMIRLGLESHYTKRKALFICVADSKMLGHQLRNKRLGPFPSNYEINKDLLTTLNAQKANGFDERFIQKMIELDLSFQAELVYNEEIIANKINLETRLLIWEVK